MVMSRRARSAVHLASAVRSASRPGGPSLLQRLRAVPRMVRAVRAGTYTGLTSTRLLMMLAGVGYIVSPVDVVPEGLLLAFGLLDDVMVIGWVATTLVKETEEFIAWEQGVAAHQAQWAQQQDWSQQQAWSSTVRSHVVPD